MKEIKNIVEVLRRFRQGSIGEPKGLPKMVSNSDLSDEGLFAQESLTEPTIKNQVTGSGGGPVIGSRARGGGNI
jgi:hypothetical protein